MVATEPSRTVKEKRSAAAVAEQNIRAAVAGNHIVAVGPGDKPRCRRAGQALGQDKLTRQITAADRLNPAAQGMVGQRDGRPVAQCQD